jgi:hypothetical protein
MDDGAAAFEIERTEIVAAETDGRDLWAVLSQGTGFHGNLAFLLTGRSLRPQAGTNKKGAGSRRPFFESCSTDQSNL